MSTRSRFRRVVSCASLLIASLLVATACSGGGASDAVTSTTSDAGAVSGAATTLDLYAFSVAKSGFDSVIPAFTASPQGQGVTIRASYGASGDQSRKVLAGASADIVSFSVEPDITRLVPAGIVDGGWNLGAHQGIPFGSLVVIVVRKGNPKGIHDWDDLLRPGVQVVTPNPFSSGSAKWNLLAPYAVKSAGGANPAAGLTYLTALITDHVKTQPGSGREATESFVQGTGDALLSYENEALFAERNGDAVEHVIPPQTFRIDNPVAVVSTGKHLAQSQAFVDFLYTPVAQEQLASAGYRVANSAVAAAHRTQLPEPAKAWTTADLGGWQVIEKSLFAKGTGSIAAIYAKVTS